VRKWQLSISSRQRGNFLISLLPVLTNNSRTTSLKIMQWAAFMVEADQCLPYTQATTRNKSMEAKSCSDLKLLIVIKTVVNNNLSLFVYIRNNHTICQNTYCINGWSSLSAPKEQFAHYQLHRLQQQGRLWYWGLQDSYARLTTQTSSILSPQR
jgi:hypothetical protein